MTDVRQQLDAMPRVAELSPEARDDLAESGRVVRIPAGWTPIHQQEPADKAYLVLEGRLCVLGGGQDVADIRVGELAGEMGLVDHRLRNAQLTATEPVQVLAWPADVFQAVRSRHDDVDRLVRACAEDRYRTEVGRLDSKPRSPSATTTTTATPTTGCCWSTTTSSTPAPASTPTRTATWRS